MLLLSAEIFGCKNENQQNVDKPQSIPSLPEPRNAQAITKPEGSRPALGWETIASGKDGPGGRSRHCLAYDKKAQAAVLFGGMAGGTRRAMGLKSDTSQLRDRRWSEVQIAEPPPPIHHGAMTYCDNIESTILFGGQGKRGQMFGVTWIYASGSWQKRPDIAGPSTRCGHCMTFDSHTGNVILFGGIDPRGNSLDDTWAFDGETWRFLRIPGPSPRRYCAFAFDSELGGCLLHGGSKDDNAQVSYGESWLLKDQKWTQLAPSMTTPVRDDHGMAYHQIARRMVLLDGFGSARGMLVREGEQWQKVDAEPMYKRHQCSPLVWDESLGGILLHGGEAHAFGSFLDATLLLRMPPASA
jgi:hypothetical protein